MKLWYSIGEFSKVCNVSARALRLYEQKGLIKPMHKNDKGYRFYDESSIKDVEKILKYKTLGFSLEEIKTVICVNEKEFQALLEKKLQLTEIELKTIKLKKQEISKLLSVFKKVHCGEEVSSTERRIFMDELQKEILTKLSQKVGKLSQKQLDFLEKDKVLYDSKEKKEFIDAVKECVNFAKDKKLLLGPSRGSASASISLYGLGFTKVDPSINNLFPERLNRLNPDLHIDVEFERGQEFVDFCFEKSRNLKYGQINAFKMPLLNIINNVEKKVKKEIPYNSVSEDIILKDIRNGDIEKIFCLDMSVESLIMKFENLFDDYKGITKLSKYLLEQQIHSYQDLLNIIALWRPNCEEKIKRISLYKKAKKHYFSYPFLSERLQKYLEPNFGRIIYHEDILEIFSEYCHWDLEKANNFRVNILRGNELPEEECLDLKNQLPKKVYDLILEESKYTFCKAHMSGFSGLIKKTAVLKSLYKKIYFDEIEKWENRFGYKWDDIGVRFQGVSLLQN